MRNFVLLSLLLFSFPCYAPPPEEARAELLRIADQTARNVRTDIQERMKALRYPAQALDLVKSLIERLPATAYTEAVLAGLLMATCPDPDNVYDFYDRARRLYERLGTEPLVAHELAMYPLVHQFETISRQRLNTIMATIEYFHRARERERPMRDRLVAEVMMASVVSSEFQSFQAAKPLVDRAIAIADTAPGYPLDTAYDLVQLAIRKSLSDAVILERYAVVLAINVESGHSDGHDLIQIDSLEFVARNAKELDLWPARFRERLKERVIDFTKQRQDSRFRFGCGPTTYATALGIGVITVAGGWVAFDFFFGRRSR